MIGVLIVTVMILSKSINGAIKNDLMDHVPGYPVDYKTAVYSGYLNTGDETRQLHYVFVESVNGENNKDPVTLWLNGGPGCSSMLGFIQQIGPYYIQDGQNYTIGDNLTENQYSWHKYSNLLFLQSPAGVGFSYNLDTSLVLNDAITADDNMKALLDFFRGYSQYSGNSFWIAGQSYAGKYIPDLAVLIDIYNINPTTPNGAKINLKGIHIGNGVMNLQSLEETKIQFFLQHSFVDPDLISYWKTSCKFDPISAGCNFFKIRLKQDTKELNPNNIYGFCYYNDSSQISQKNTQTQQSLLYKAIHQAKNSLNTKFNYSQTCLYFDGVANYFNSHQIDYKAKFSGQKWNGPCASNITYFPDSRGSISSYRYLLGIFQSRKYQISLYNGNLDQTVPFIDTLAGIKELNLQESAPPSPWFTNGQHSGFVRIFSGILLHSIKGGSHMAPQSKRAESQHLFELILAGHNSFNQFSAPKNTIEQF